MQRVPSAGRPEIVERYKGIRRGRGKKLTEEKEVETLKRSSGDAGWWWWVVVAMLAEVAKEEEEEEEEKLIAL